MRFMFTLVALAACFLPPMALRAVQVDSNAFRNQAIFGIEFPGENRAFLGREDAVTSIAKQEYVTAAFRVVELNIVTEGRALLRVYYSRPLKAGEMQAALGAGAGALPGGGFAPRPALPEAVQKMADQASNVAEEVTAETVVKEYPIATHAGTIEYRVRRLSEVNELYDELHKHWTKEPAFFEDGRIVDEEGTRSERKPRSLGGTLFRVEE